MADTLKQLFSNDKADELIEAISAPKVDKQQGTGNAGKALMVGNDGLVYPAVIDTSDKVNLNQGVANSGKAMMVGSDGNVAPKSIEASDVTVESGVKLDTRLGNVVRADTAQTFTDAEKAQALANVGGASSSDVDELHDELDATQSEIDSVKTKAVVTSIFTLTSDLKNGATITDNVVTIPSGQTGNQTYLGVRTFVMASIKGTTLHFSIPFEISETILTKMLPVVYANGTGVSTKNIIFADSTIDAEIEVPSDATATYVLVALKSVNNTVLSSDATITMNDYSIIGSGSLIDGIRNVVNESLPDYTDLETLEDIKNTSFTSYFSLVSATNHGATVDGATLTVPAGQTGNQDYIAIRVLGDVDKVKGHTFDMVVPYTISANLAGNKTAIILQANGTGTSFNSSSWDGETVKASITVADNATSTYVTVGVKVVSNTAFAENATITVGNYVVTKTVTLENGIANLLGSGRFYCKKMSCFGDSYTSQEGWQPKTKEILGLASYSNVAIYGGVLTTGYEGIQNVDLDSNILTIFYGTNDYSNNIPVGTIEDDATNPTTFYGALKYVFEWVSINLPKCLVVPITHTQRWKSQKDLEFISNNGYGTGGQPKNNAGFSLLDYANAIIDVANRYGYKVLDFNRWGQVNKNNESSFYGNDHLHPTATSYTLLGNKIAKFIQQE